MHNGLITEEHITFLSGSYRLEGILDYPDDTKLKAALLFLSPHPHMGGNMDNNVIRHLSRRCAEESCLTLRFNYHGVGKSELTLPEGTTVYDYWATLEQEERYDDLMLDVYAAYRKLEQAMPPQTPIVLVGYSLGAILALRLAQQLHPHFVVAISPPNKKRKLPDAHDIHLPVQCIGGDQDPFFDSNTLSDWIADAPNNKSMVVMPGCDHFFRKQEEDLFEYMYPMLSTHAQQNESR